MQLTRKLRSALAVARQFPEEFRHAEQVARLCGLLFDAFGALHGLGARERELLLCAALLHDVGLSLTIAGHHRASLEMILDADLPALSVEERLIVANVARYHRKAHPSRSHEHFAALAPAEQKTVRRLAAILRVADGLDRAHENAVDAIAAAPADEGSWTLLVSGPGDLKYACWGASRKAGLFREAYGRKLKIEPATARVNV